MGVFATRSPFRPNPVGLSSVKLVSVRPSAAGRQLELIVSGADVLDGTPIYDIKPYLSFSDSHPDAKNGFANETKDYRLKVDWGKFTLDDLSKTDRERTDITPIMTREWQEEMTYILSQDPRPAYQDDSNREYRLDYGGITVTFVVKDGTVFVKNLEKM